MSNIIDDYFNIFYLIKNCKPNQIINYLNNYENKEKLKNLFKIENIYGITPFNIIFQNNYINEDILLFLINNFRLLNISNQFKLLPIHYAIEFLKDQKKKLLKIIIDNTNLNLVNDIFGNNIYHNLIFFNREFSFNYLKYIYYKYKINNFDKKNKLGFTPLLNACDLSNNLIIKFLIEIGCDYNVYNNNLNNCLMYCCMHNNFEIIKLLIEKNVNINFKDKQSDTALSYSCGCDLQDNCNLQIIKYLIKNGADYNIINSENNNLLIYATGAFAKYNNFKIDIDVIKFLIDLGCDYKIKNNYNKTFFDYLIDKDINIFNDIINLYKFDIEDNKLIEYYYLYDINIKLNVKKININSECLICFDEFNKNEEILKCDNNHYYHAKCLIKWFKQKNNELICPTCKTEFKFDDKILNIED